MTDEEILSSIPPRPPSARLLWTAIIDVGDRTDLEKAPWATETWCRFQEGIFTGGRVSKTFPAQSCPVVRIAS